MKYKLLGSLFCWNLIAIVKHILMLIVFVPIMLIGIPIVDAKSAAKMLLDYYNALGGTKYDIEHFKKKVS